MSELGDVLELLYGARGRYESVRAEVRERRNYRLQGEAYERTRRKLRGTASMQRCGPRTSRRASLSAWKSTWPRVLVERGARRVELSSSTYTSDKLVDLALVPAPRERPPLLE